MKYVTATLLVAIFALCAHYSWLPLIGYLVVLNTSAASHIARTLDCLLAAMLPFGWTGRNTVSKECGLELQGGKPCRFCRVLCAVLSYRFTLFGREFFVLEDKHCQKEAS